MVNGEPAGAETVVGRPCREGAGLEDSADGVVNAQRRLAPGEEREEEGVVGEEVDQGFEFATEVGWAVGAIL